jgi:predicted ATPase
MRTVHDYFSQHPSPPVGWDGNQICRVFTGLSVFADLRSRLLGRTQSERDSVRHYEDFLSGNFFGGMKVILVPVEEDGNDVVHIKIGNKEEYPIYQLGDGLQSLIICTYPIVTEQKPGSLFFIEEPDLGMHPSL